MQLEQEIRSMIESFDGKIGIALKELPNGSGFEINADQPYRAASVIKVPIMHEIFRKSEQGKLDLNSVHKVSDNNIQVGSGVIRSLSSMPYTIKDLVTLMIIVSDNSATNECIDIATYDGVTSSMKDLGLINTVLVRKMLGQKGGDVSFSQDNTISPKDSILLLEDIYNASTLSRDSCDSILDIMKAQQLRNKLPRYLPVDTESATKGGTVRHVANDIGILYFSKPIAVSILSMDVPHSSYGDDLIAKMSQTIYKYYSS